MFGRNVEGEEVQMLRCLFEFLCAAQGSSETGWKERASVLDWHTYVMLTGE